MRVWMAGGQVMLGVPRAPFPAHPGGVSSFLLASLKEASEKVSVLGKGTVLPTHPLNKAQMALPRLSWNGSWRVTCPVQPPASAQASPLCYDVWRGWCVNTRWWLIQLKV